ncbi:hypothetical protein C3K47_15410 [Solitalea longa]|uniref:HEAT repeat domain-containing protein n=1 Tax=Solitalea longa TaxID=2079460 RepID=A0A2S4ZYS9_9SPHI|nr:HEAT repeat domain-containing protein [Solitalea longa]POY35446.1 hypothetical protein C3K47_15410 [Solitalea longa]
MAFYNLTKAERVKVVETIRTEVLCALQFRDFSKANFSFSHNDTYIRKAAYLAIGKIYLTHTDFHHAIISMLEEMQNSSDFKIRQTVINAAGEIGKVSFEQVQLIFERGLFDAHHSPRNAVIGSIKKMGEVNPVPVLKWAKEYLHHPDKEIRREICHGIELRGRKYPQDILPLLKELEFDKTVRVRNTLVHVLGQIAYKKGCLKTVVEHLKSWGNTQIVKEALAEIIDVHHRYRNFSALTQEEAKAFISISFPSMIS